MNPRPDLPHADHDSDDALLGSILSRRRALRLLGLGGGAAALAAGGVLAQRSATGTASSAAGGLPGCIVRPAMTEGPYFVDSEPRRADLRRDTTTGAVSAGVPLTLTFAVSRVATTGCAPRSNVLIDVWHCDALGVYSGVSGNSGNFLRGSLVTDAQGRATFTTVYPGWYRGRAVHIHFKLRPLDAAGRATGEFTSQLFFPENVNSAVFARAPYRQKGTKADTPNASDGIYRNGGSQLLLDVKGDAARGYAATFDVGLNIG